jgi:hypothetical protein
MQMIAQARKVQKEAKEKETKERVIGAREEKEITAKERVIGAKEEKEIGAKEEKDSAANREQSKERERAKERREVKARMNSHTEMNGIGGDNNRNGQEEIGTADSIHLPHRVKNHGCADFAH